MLTVVDTYPENYQENVPIDIAISITFNKEVKDEYLTSQYFRIFVLPDYTGVIACNITKDPDNPNKVNLSPIDNLPKLTQFEVWVAGDMNLADGTKQGIVSTDGEVMDANYVFRFTTGTEQEIDTITDVDVIDSDGSASDNSTSSDDYPRIIKTVPQNNAYGIECSGYTTASGTIDLYFDRAVSYHTGVSGDNPTEEVVELNIVPLDDITSYIPHDEIHGERLGWNDIDVSYHPEHIDDHTVVRLRIDRPWRCNSDIELRIYEAFWTEGIEPEKLYSSTKDNPYIVTFRTILYPMLTTSRAVRRMLGYSITGLSDKLIDEYILVTSLDVIDEYFNGVFNPSILSDSWVKRLVTCLVAQRLIGSVINGYVGIVRQRTLGDLNIVYDNDLARSSLPNIDDCISKAESHVLGGLSRTGVKSGATAHYPDRRRKIFE